MLIAMFLLASLVGYLSGRRGGRRALVLAGLVGVGFCLGVWLLGVAQSALIDGVASSAFRFVLFAGFVMAAGPLALLWLLMLAPAGVVGLVVRARGASADAVSLTRT